jgi:hypothetical protein
MLLLLLCGSLQALQTPVDVQQGDRREQPSRRHATEYVCMKQGYVMLHVTAVSADGIQTVLKLYTLALPTGQHIVIGQSQRFNRPRPSRYHAVTHRCTVGPGSDLDFHWEVQVGGYVQGANSHAHVLEVTWDATSCTNIAEKVKALNVMKVPKSKVLTPSKHYSRELLEWALHRQRAGARQLQHS